MTVLYEITILFCSWFKGLKVSAGKGVRGKAFVKTYLSKTDKYNSAKALGVRYHAASLTDATVILNEYLTQAYVSDVQLDVYSGQEAQDRRYLTACFTEQLQAMAKDPTLYERLKAELEPQGEDL